MYLYVHITRLLFYGVLGFEAWVGELPWWIVLAWVLYDNGWYALIRIPFTKGKQPKTHELGLQDIIKESHNHFRQG